MLYQPHEKSKAIKFLAPILGVIIMVISPLATLSLMEVHNPIRPQALVKTPKNIRLVES